MKALEATAGVIFWLIGWISGGGISTVILYALLESAVTINNSWFAVGCLWGTTGVFWGRFMRNQVASFMQPEDSARV